ncbi:MAG: transposase [Patescibacteria group bacterium]
MPRIERIDVGDYVYHVLNRANGRLPIFDQPEDYQLFETILEEAVEKFDMRLLAYCLMPNHWHLVLYPKEDGDLARFMGWLTNTHTRRWHTWKGTIGQGHLYQGRYKSFLCEEDQHFLTLVRYVERNAKKANLVKVAEGWRWSSVWKRENGVGEQKTLLTEWPVTAPENYLDWLNETQTESEEESIGRSTTKGNPYGSMIWVDEMVKKFNLRQTLRGVGRPKKNGG